MKRLVFLAALLLAFAAICFTIAVLSKKKELK